MSVEILPAIWHDDQTDQTPKISILHLKTCILLKEMKIQLHVLLTTYLFCPTEKAAWSGRPLF